MIEAEYNEIEDSGEELDFAESDSLPWLEADEDEAAAGGIDTAQMVGFFALLAVIGLAVVGAVYFVSNYNRGPVAIPDGSLIAAPEGPYKERPTDPGGKEFAGTDDVAPGVGQGESPDLRMSDSTGADSGDQDLTVPMPPIAGGQPLPGGEASSNGAKEPSAPETASAPAASSSADSAGVGVQVGAYSSRARAEQGWRTLQGQSAALAGLKRRIVEGQADRGSVFRLQALAPSVSEANALCARLRRDGLDCQVKP